MGLRALSFQVIGGNQRLPESRLLSCNTKTILSISKSEMTVFHSSLLPSLFCKPHIPLLLHKTPEGLSSVCIFCPLEALSCFRRLPAFLQSGNVFTGSFFSMCPMESTLGQEPGRQTCSLRTAPLRHRRCEEEAWQLIDTNEARITINFKQIPFGPHFAV